MLWENLYHFKVDIFNFSKFQYVKLDTYALETYTYIVPKYLRYRKDKYWVTRLRHLIFTTCYSNCLMRIIWRVGSGTGVEHVGARAKSVMRKKAYRVTFSIRDACDVRSFRLNFLDRVGSINFERVVWLNTDLSLPIYISRVFNEWCIPAFQCVEHI